MKDVLIMISAFLYVLAVIIITCYMTINHGWYWIFLLFLAHVKIGGDKKDDENERQSFKDQ